MGGCDSRNQVGCTGPRGGDHNPHSSRCSGIAVRSVGCPLLMRSQYMLYPVLMGIQAVVYVQNLSAGITEHRITALLDQGFHKYICS